MTRLFSLLVLTVLFAGSPAFADIITDPDENEEGIAGIPTGPYRSGRLEINPILSVRFSGSAVVYRAGMSLGYSLSRGHQLGGSFVMGNRVWDRANRRDVVVETTGGIRTLPGNTLSVDEGFGSSLTAFYRYNIPVQVKRKTYPFVEVFGGRDFGWGDVSEVGGGVGARRFVSKNTAWTTQYSYMVLFANGQHVGRHVIAGGMSVFFR